jgi:hypothetical protein
MRTKLSEMIGKSIAKAPPGGGDEETAESEDDTDESPGAMLAEALGISDADSAAIDAALRAAIRKLS